MSVSFFGDFDTTETVILPFNTFDSNDPSASVTLTNLANTDVHIHKDGSLTQRSSSAGVAVDIDVDGIAGCHWVTIDLSDNTDAGFYANGSQIAVRIEGVTVDAGTINPFIGAFTIGRMLRPTTAGRTLDVTATGAAGIDWANVENPTTALDLSATDIQLADTVTTLTNKTGFSLAATGLDAITQAATGMVEIAKAVWDRALTGATHNIGNSAGRRLRSLQDFGLYEGGAVWIDTVNGTAGTTDFENGTVTNPVLTLADARTLATSLGLGTFQIINGSTITLASNSDNLTFMGENWILALGGQSIANIAVSGAIDVSGVSSGNDSRFQRCHIKTCTLGNTWASDCRLGGTVTLISTGGHFFQSCYATTGTVPIVDLGAVGAQTLCLTPLTGGVQINNTAAGDLVHIEGQGEILLDSSCNGGTLEYAGDFRFTDNSTAITVNPDDNTVNLAAVLVDTGTTLDTKVNDIQGATFSSATDSLEAIRNRGDAAWTTGAGGSPPDLLQSTSIATLASQTSFTLTAGSADDGAYIGATAVVTDQATATQKAVGLISAYTGSTKTVTLAVDPGIFTMATTDTIDIVAAPKSLPAQLPDGAGGLPVSDAGALDLDAEFAKLGTPAADISADIAALKVDTGTTIPALLPAALVGGRIDANLGAISGDATAADNLEASTETIVLGTVSTGTTTATTTVFAASDITEATADHYIGRVIIFRTGALAFQATDITDYVLTSGEGVFTVTAMTEAPANMDTFVVL